jgi:DNA/RNA endonuclease YhcR with UshA esterase domain
MHRSFRVAQCIVLGLFLFCTSNIVSAATNLSAAQAKNHIGEKATVCGTVAGVHTATNSKGSPTFINLDERYPHQVFTILIWGEDLNKFNPAPSAWDGKRVCATGTISSYRGAPEIVTKDPTQITFPK